jgi:cell division protein FtsW (lipid II flippase)
MWVQSTLLMRWKDFLITQSLVPGVLDYRCLYRFWIFVGPKPIKSKIRCKVTLCSLFFYLFIFWVFILASCNLVNWTCQTDAPSRRLKPGTWYIYEKKNLFVSVGTYVCICVSALFPYQIKSKWVSNLNYVIVNIIVTGNLYNY